MAIALVVVLAGVMPVGAAAPPSVDVAVRSTRYDPVGLTVTLGTRVRWKNVTSPSRAHDVVSSFPGYFKSPLMVTGQSFRFTFSAAGTLHACLLDPRRDDRVVEVPLRAQLVTTGDAPYFSSTLGTAVLPPTSRYRYVLNWQLPGDPTWQVRATRDNILIVPATVPGSYTFARASRTGSAARSPRTRGL